MKEESKEKMKLLEKEMGTLTDKLETLNKDLRELEDLKNEIKGLKIFLGRAHPDFKTRFPEIMEKLYKKK